MQSYQKLHVRQKSIGLVEETYKITSLFPSKEFSLIDQIKRSVVSIASNIAEGDQRNTIKENINFLFIAKGSAAELQTQIFIAKKLGFINEDKQQNLDNKITEILKMISALISYKRKNPK